MKLFLRPTFYPGNAQYKQDLETATTMTDDEYTAFYDAAAPLSFQNTYLTSL